MKLYIGYDRSEDLAYKVARRSLARFSSIPVEPLNHDRLRSVGLYSRLIDERAQKYDLVSNAPCSTDFAATRFLVPILCQTGYAMFTDCDVIFLDDPMMILDYIDPSKAVSVVQHKHPGLEKSKMCGLAQTMYLRKNWSSVMVFNCDHPANQRLTVNDISIRPGRDLHRFYWLADDEIGSLPREWNWLVGVQPKPDAPRIAHFTLGGPWFKEWERTEHDEIWIEAANSGRR